MGGLHLERVFLLVGSARRGIFMVLLSGRKGDRGELVAQAAASQGRAAAGLSRYACANLT